ncbi:MAG: hypothetical protein WA738_22025 [Candidatus Angelobacter sp.]
MDLQSNSQSNRRQQTVYASLLRFAPETIPLRQRLVDRLVLASLENSTEAKPKRMGAIQAAIQFGSNSPNLRIELIQETLQRLIAQGKIKQTEVRKRSAYYVDQKGREEIASVYDSAADLFAPILAKLQLDADVSLRTEIAKVVYKNFICECFSRFGTQIARNVAREIDSDSLLQAIELEEAFQVALVGVSLSSQALESLRARCFRFIRSADPEETKLKFALAQGFYLAHLLGVGSTSFNPVAEDAFAHSVFYLDSNILFVGLLSSFDHLHLFEETVKIARRIGIELRVTRATIDEIRRVAADKKRQLAETLERVPQQLVDRARDSILEAFLERRENQSTLTVEEFFRPFDQLTDTVLNRWGVQVHDQSADELIADRDVSVVTNTLQQQVVKFRKRQKGPSVLRHDIAHYLLVNDSRQQEPKTWFLTLDRSMIATASVLAGRNEQPFCFNMLGFLQAISPFVTSESEQASLADLFNRLMGDQFFSNDKMFDMQELMLLSRMHEDVMSTPPEQLVLAFDFIKNNILRGKQYTIEDYPKVALELRKFLTCSDDKRRHNLAIQLKHVTTIAARLERQLSAALEAQQVADSESRKLSRAAEEYHKENDKLANENCSLSSSIRKLATDNTTLDARLNRWAKRVGISACGIATLVGSGLMIFAPGFVTTLSKSWHAVMFGKSLAAIGICLVLASAVWLLRGMNLPENIKLGTLVLLMIASIKLSGIASVETLAYWQTYIESGAFFVSIVIVYANKEKLVGSRVESK